MLMTTLTITTAADVFLRMPFYNSLSYKHLSINITTSLNSNFELNISNAKWRSRCLNCSVYNPASSLKGLMYATYLRPALKDACSLWNPHLDYILHSAKAHQSCPARIMFFSHYSRNTSSTHLRLAADLGPLRLRRKIFKLRFLRKVYSLPALNSATVSRALYFTARCNNSCKFKQI